jgi:hypothetical protein
MRSTKRPSLTLVATFWLRLVYGAHARTKPRRFRIWAIASVLAFSQFAVPQQGVVSSIQNPLQLALKHWYQINSTTTFAVGSDPAGIAFDGANIWVANFVRRHRD